MSDITGAVVALLALKNSGVLDALKDPSKKNLIGHGNQRKDRNGNVEVYDPNIDYTVTTISGKLSRINWHVDGILVN